MCIFLIILRLFFVDCINSAFFGLIRKLIHMQKVLIKYSNKSIFFIKIYSAAEYKKETVFFASCNEYNPENECNEEDNCYLYCLLLLIRSDLLLFHILYILHIPLFGPPWPCNGTFTSLLFVRFNSLDATIHCPANINWSRHAESSKRGVGSDV